MLSDRTTIATIFIIGIVPPSGVGADISCIITPNAIPPMIPAMAPATILDRIASLH
jgi:hypothetical protein